MNSVTEQKTRVAKVSDEAHLRLRVAAAARDMTIGDLATQVILAALPPVDAPDSDGGETE